MHTNTFKRLVTFLMVLCLLLPCLAASGETANRYAQVYDASGGAGRLTARFLWLGSFDDDYSPGDCTIITSPDGQVMVIDAGLPASAQLVCDALDALGITRIDYLVASHPHIDHIGGFPALMRKYEIGALYTSAVTYETSSHYGAYMACAKLYNIPHIILSDGDSFMFGESVQAQVLWPQKEIPYYEGYPDGTQRTQFINNQSLVLKLTYGEGSMLFSGDLYTLGERSVIALHADELNCTVAKINHHGNDTSSSKLWRDATQPKAAVAMSDGLPSMSILKRYAALGEMRQTLLDGDVRVRMDDQGALDILTGKDRTTDMFD